MNTNEINNDKIKTIVTINKKTSRKKPHSFGMLKYSYIKTYFKSVIFLFRLRLRSSGPLGCITSFRKISNFKTDEPGMP